MEVEALLSAWLSVHAPVPAFGDVPADEDKPESFLTVERTGGAVGKDGIDRATVAVQCWAASNAAAARLAYDAASLAESLEGEARVAGCTVNSVHKHPTEKKEPRYQVVLDVAAYI